MFASVDSDLLCALAAESWRRNCFHRGKRLTSKDNPKVDARSTQLGKSLNISSPARISPNLYRHVRNSLNCGTLASARQPVLGCLRPCSKIIPKSIHSKLLPLFEAATKELGYAKGVTAKRTIGKRLPSPKKRLCKVHGRPIRPDRWRSGHRTTGCADCYRTKNMPSPKKRLCKEHDLPIISSVGGPGTGTRVVLAVLKCRHQRKGCVASITNRSNPAVG